ncbi:hypothetical protein [Cryobacterium frigoriphilum]|nr:hypothetical protein [Cryobacterium frigoriphilum]
MSLSLGSGHSDDVLAATDMAVPVAAGLTTGTHDDILERVLLALASVLMLALVVSGFLARRPATLGWLRDADGHTPDLVRAAPLSIHCPSLTLLSISRV